MTTPVGKKGGECSICLEALRQEQAVELPGCAARTPSTAGASPRGSARRPTCTLCGENVTQHLDPELQKHLAEFCHEDDQDPPGALDSSGNAIAAPPSDLLLHEQY